MGFEKGEDEPPARRQRWIELPLFNGEDTPGWEDQIGQYFEIQDVPQEQWLSTAKSETKAGAAVGVFTWGSFSVLMGPSPHQGREEWWISSVGTSFHHIGPIPHYKRTDIEF